MSNPYKWFSIEKIGGKVKVQYRDESAGLGGVIYKKEQNFLYQLGVQQYIDEFLTSAEGKSFDSAKITINNRLTQSYTSPTSVWSFLFAFLVTNSNYNAKHQNAKLLNFHLVSESLENFKKYSGLTEDIILSYATEYLSNFIENQENEGNVIPPATEIKLKSSQITNANLNQASIDKQNEALSQYGLGAGTGNNKTIYIIIGVIAIAIGYFIWKKRK